MFEGGKKKEFREVLGHPLFVDWFENLHFIVLFPTTKGFIIIQKEATFENGG